MSTKGIYASVIISVIAITLLSCSQTDKDINIHKNCKHCNMDREKFDFSRMLIEYEDGTSIGLCSIRCAAVELNQNRDKKVKYLLVADYMTKKLTDARTAIWVIGGEQHGVMTSVAKWAFTKTEDARKFVNENGGKVSSFEEAIKIAEDEVLQSRLNGNGADTCSPAYVSSAANAAQI
jgi:copper chaperone NosL